jgi:CRP/FNR family cyclic AMP-dependent transcriptional regulator
VGCSCKLSRTNRVTELPSGLEPRFLEGLTPNTVRAIVGAAKHLSFRAGEQIIEEGEPSKRLVMLTSGRGRHFVLTSQGRKILLHWMTTGQVVGGVTLLEAPTRYLASVEVLDDCCALVWERSVIRAWAKRCPRLIENMFTIAVVEHIAWLVSMHVSLVADDARGRVAHLLMSLAVAIGKPNASGYIEVQITNADIAGGANVRHWTVGRVLAEWEKAGTIRKRRGAIALLKMMNLGSR